MPGDRPRWPEGAHLGVRWTVEKTGDFSKCPETGEKIGIMSARNKAAVHCPICHKKHYPREAMPAQVVQATTG